MLKKIFLIKWLKINKDYFDKRTRFAVKYPSIENDSEKKNILELICKFRNYYNEECDSFESFDDTISTIIINLIYCFVEKHVMEKEVL